MPPPSALLSADNLASSFTEKMKDQVRTSPSSHPTSIQYWYLYPHLLLLWVQLLSEVNTSTLCLILPSYLLKAVVPSPFTRSNHFSSVDHAHQCIVALISDFLKIFLTLAATPSPFFLSPLKGNKDLDRFVYTYVVFNFSSF